MHIALHPYKSPFGELLIGAYKGKICLCDWRFRKMRVAIDRRLSQYYSADFKIDNCAETMEVQNQLESYFHKERQEFDLAIEAPGTEFQQKVWNALREIPYGTTLSYLELSRKLNNENAIRAVASANGANAISIIIPCHRVVGSKGELTGYAGGLTAKKKLLELEGREVQAELDF